MVTLRPHILTFTTPGTPGGTDSNGFPLPDVLGATIHVPCRFHQTSGKIIKNEDSTESAQVGRIRVDIGSPMPLQWANIVVTEGDLTHYQGQAKYVDKTGSLISWRIDV